MQTPGAFPAGEGTPNKFLSGRGSTPPNSCTAKMAAGAGSDWQTGAACKLQASENFADTVDQRVNVCFWRCLLCRIACAADGMRPRLRLRRVAEGANPSALVRMPAAGLPRSCDQWRAEPTPRWTSQCCRSTLARFDTLPRPAARLSARWCCASLAALRCRVVDNRMGIGSTSGRIYVRHSAGRADIVSVCPRGFSSLP